jgi:hypothetical protein
MQRVEKKLGAAMERKGVEPQKIEEIIAAIASCSCMVFLSPMP